MRAARDIDAQPLPGIAYTARPDATAEAELSALATVYRFILSKSNASQKPVDPPQSSTATTTRRKHGFPPAVAYLGAVERVLDGSTDEGR
jgi:hypothetical protein